MSRPQTFEQNKLLKVEKIIQSLVKSYAERMLLLETLAAYVSDADIEEYWNEFDVDNCDFSVAESDLKLLKDTINKSGISIPKAISSLFREPISLEKQKENGVFYTDFRLAEMIANKRKKDLRKDSSVVDFAAGTGILLVGLAEVYKQKYYDNFENWISKYLYAFDLSANALRGVASSILSMTPNVKALKEMTSKWKVCDSLLDEKINNMKFDVVVGNPPWGKIKLSRHDFSLQQGEKRIYGSDYTDFDVDEFKDKKNDIAEYSKLIRNKYDLLGNAEPDMYMAFLQKAITSATDVAGKITFLVPAGLIRSQGTETIREYLVNNTSEIEISLMDNKATFFSIDSRFKFLLISITNGKANKVRHIGFKICATDNGKISEGELVKFNVRELKRIRPDLTIPEVHTSLERDIFYKIIKNGRQWGVSEDEWTADINREVDMTNDKKNFVVCSKKKRNDLPIIEGRMVQQHRFGVKSYVSGSGRSAIWSPCAQNGKAQFFISPDKLNSSKIDRVKNMRAGYCDIAGQTNERAMMSAIIPGHVVCGNKVPTITFPNGNDDLLYLWVGITNSFVYDWMIRRVISTTINYFLLFSIPIPNIDFESEIAQKIIDNTKKLAEMGEEYYQGKQMQFLRAEIDAMIAIAYGLSLQEFEIIMKDFPLLDRKQPPIEGEKESTVTRDLVLSIFNKLTNGDNVIYSDRNMKANQVNANAYIPTEMVSLC